jgi:hypothetical protein
MRLIRTLRVGRFLIFTAASLALIASVSLRAQRGGGGGAAAKPLVPLAASSLVQHPELYMGQTVSVTGVAEKAVTPTTFIFDQGKSQPAGGADILVIAPTLTGTLPLQSYITVIGDAVKFDPADVARRLKNYTLDLPADVVAKYLGKPVILATGIIDPKMVDIAKPVVAPPTPEENAFDGVMKQVGPGFTALQQAITASSGDQVRAKVVELHKLFGDTQTFFTNRKTTDAIGWAGDAAKLTQDIDQAATAGKWDDAKAAATKLNGICGQCHAAHRERQDDGSYRVKG